MAPCQGLASDSRTMAGMRASQKAALCTGRAARRHAGPILLPTLGGYANICCKLCVWAAGSMKNRATEVALHRVW